MSCGKSLVANATISIYADYKFTYIVKRRDRILFTSDALGNTTGYLYGIDGKLSQVTDAKSHSIKYEYDSRSRPVKMTDQLGNTETYAYDTSDNLTSLKDRKGQTTTYTYDAMNRLSQATYSDGSTISYTYDSTGKVLTTTDSRSGTISYTYSSSDSCGSGCDSTSYKIASETTPLGSVSYTYDDIGRRSGMTVSGQSAVNYSYNAVGRLTSIDTTINGSAAHFGIGYDTLDRRTSLTLPNGVSVNYGYDNASKLLDIQHLNSSNQAFESLTYTYDAVGNKTKMSRPSVSLPLSAAASNTSYNEANHVLSFNDKAITYDANGNMTSVANTCGTTTYTWDARNRLTGISGFNTDCIALTASFQYDALNRRIGKTINGTATQYLYDGMDIIQEKQNESITANYIRTLNIDEPLARIKSDGTVRYYHADAQGSIIDLTDGSGNVKTTYTCDPFGNVTISGETSDNPFQYTGRENDGTGLYYYRARYYSPEMHRFISEDPIGFEGGDINFYVYIANNPVNYVDLLGLSGWRPVPGMTGWEVRHDNYPEPHDHYKHRGKERARKVCPNGDQSKHGEGDDKDVPQEVIDARNKNSAAVILFFILTGIGALLAP
jgi:RHS repeat-associated protein